MAARSVSVAIALVAATGVTMIFGELVPKNLAIARPEPVARAERPARIICDCIGVTDRDIMDAARDGAVTWNELQQKTKIGTVCGKCRTQAMEVLVEALFEIHHETLKMHE